MTVIKGKAYYEMPVYETISDMFQQSYVKHAADHFLTYREKPGTDSISLTYQDIADQIEYLNTVWSDLELTDQRLGIVGGNSYPWVTSYLAATESQAMVIPLDNLLTAHELGQLIVRSKTDILCVDALTLIKFSNDLTILRDLKLIQIMNVHHLSEKDLVKLAELKTQLD